MDIGELLAFGVKNGASDLHLSAGLPPMIRVDGDVKSHQHAVALDPTRKCTSIVYDIMNDKQRKDYEEFLETTSRSRSRGSPAFVSTRSTISAAPARCSGRFLPRS